MTLIVSIINKDDIDIDTEYLENQVPSPHNDLFGFEVCRKTLWGSKLVHELGCELISSLRNTDIYAFDDDLDKLSGEFLVLLEHLDELILHTGYDKRFIEFRVRNALEMIKIALTEKDKAGIAIW